MTGAIEFLRNAKAICKSRKHMCGSDYTLNICPMYDLCNSGASCIREEQHLVRKVMDYRLEEAK